MKRSTLIFFIASVSISLCPETLETLTSQQAFAAPVIEKKVIKKSACPSQPSTQSCKKTAEPKKISSSPPPLTATISAKKPSAVTQDVLSSTLQLSMGQEAMSKTLQAETEGHDDHAVTKQSASVSRQKTASAPAKKTTHKITVCNKLNKDMVTYKKHWSGNHTPQWNLKINGKKVISNETVEVELKNNKLVIEFYFEFYALGRLHRKGTAVAEFALDPTTKDIAIEFSWDKPERLIVKSRAVNSKKSPPPVLLKFYEKN